MGEKYYLSACGRGLKYHPVFNTARSLRILFEDILYIQFSNEIDSLGIFFFFLIDDVPFLEYIYVLFLLCDDKTCFVLIYPSWLP